MRHQANHTRAADFFCRSGIACAHTGLVPRPQPPQPRDPTGLFSGKAGVYDRFRPGYPQECLDVLAEALAPATDPLHEPVIADVGAGTGLFTQALASRGWTVIAVEPNPDMAEEARRRLEGLSHVRVLTGSAECTGLADRSIDLVTAAQAFHWFDAASFAGECHRILRPGGLVGLVWNSRTPGVAVHEALREVCRRHCPAFRGFSGGLADAGGTDESVRDFFGGNGVKVFEFPHDIVSDKEGFVGRQLSASYAPKAGSPEYSAYVEDLGEVFDRFAEGGTIALPHVTLLYLGVPA